MKSSHEPDSDLELATARRLRRLAEMPVDLAALEASISRAVPRPAKVVAWTRVFTRPILAAAASLTLLASLAGTILLFSQSPVEASAQLLTDLYTHTDAMLVDAPTDNPMPCCVRQVDGRNVTCVSLDVAGKRVMMTVGDGRHFRVPESAGRKSVGGVEYRFQSSGKINMVMAVRDGAWICLMGEPSVDELILRFSTMDRPH